MQRFLHRIAQYRASNYFTGSIKQSLLTISTGYITLTAAGRQRAEDVLERHTLLFPFHLYTVEHSRVLPAARSRRSRMPD